MEKWQAIDFENCPECGGDIEVYTMADDNECYDGDTVRCSDCTFTSCMSVDEDGSAWIQDNWRVMDKEKLKELCEKATPGPWHVMKEGFSKGRGAPTVYATNEDLNYVAKCADFACFHSGPRNLENADFIAAAREALPALLSENEELRRERDEARECAEVYLKCLNGSTKAKYTAEMYDAQIARVEAAEQREKDLAAKYERLREGYRQVVQSHEYAIIAIQSAYIAGETESAEQGMVWLHNFLCGPGLIPSDEDIRCGAQTYSDKNDPYRAACEKGGEG